MIFFKHCYWPEAHDWGVLGLPKTQHADTALKIYQKQATVLLAQTKGKEGELQGQIFAICTLLGKCGRTRDLGNPRVVTEDYIATWPECLVIDRFWHLKQPVDYSSFGEDVAAQIMYAQGRFIKIAADAEISQWLIDAKRTEEFHVFRAEHTLEYLQQYGKSP